MTPTWIHDLLRTRPAPGPARQEHYAHCGQLFGWITQPDARFLVDWLPDAAAEYGRPMQIVEVGTFAGSTARGLVVLSGGGEVVSIDNFFDMNEQTLNGHPDGRSFWEWTQRESPDLTGCARLVIGESPVIGAAWPSPIDLLLIDGDHHYGPALADLCAFTPHVAPGGYLLVDDMQMHDVKRAVDDWRVPNEWETVRDPSDEPAPASMLCLRRL